MYGCVPDLDVQNACVYGLVIDIGSFMDVTVLLFKLLNSKPAAGFRRSRPWTRIREVVRSKGLCEF
jgi:hypothetical protein